MSKGPNRLTRPERIRDWVAQYFHQDRVEVIFESLVDVAAGNRDGSEWEYWALEQIFPPVWDTSREGPWDKRADAIEFAEAECGVAWRVVRRGGKWVLQTRGEEG